MQTDNLPSFCPDRNKDGPCKECKRFIEMLQKDSEVFPCDNCREMFVDRGTDP